jgi:hypothetical protein
MLCNEHLHIVSFDVPFPPDYGGVMDVYYKAKALAEYGLKIHLHCFQYGRENSPELEKMCYSVTYYPRKMLRNPFFADSPFIVATRNSDQLLKNLLADEYPIFFEGLHCCSFLDHPALSFKKRIVRNHNIEHIYYLHLSRVERNIFKRFFFRKEAQRLKDFEQKLNQADSVAAISPSDHEYLNRRYNNSFYLPVFHPNETVEINTGKGNYILYHGNLAVGENNEAAVFLVKEVFSKIKIPFFIAGNNASKELQKAVKKYSHVKLITGNTHEIFDLIKNAQINILPTFQNTGIKLKLLNVLFRGRHCIVNDTMIKDTGLSGLCNVAPTASEMIEKIEALMDVPFTQPLVEERKAILETDFCNRKNVMILINRYFSDKMQHQPHLPSHSGF